VQYSSHSYSGSRSSTGPANAEVVAAAALLTMELVPLRSSTQDSLTGRNDEGFEVGARLTTSLTD
jgi:hypothetical protein